MSKTELDKYSELICQRLDDLIKENALAAAAQCVAELDQQAIGPLSRMDALQPQATAQAQQRRRHGQCQALIQALRRTIEREFGDCIDCGDEIDVAYLREKPSVTAA